MTGILFALCVLAAYPYMRGFLGAAWLAVRNAASILRFKWRTRSMRRKAWRNPKDTAPWTAAECATIAAALGERMGFPPESATARNERNR